MLFDVTCIYMNVEFFVQNATDGDKVQIECKVSGSPKPEITWFLNKKEIKPSAVRGFSLSRSDYINLHVVNRITFKNMMVQQLN